MTNVLKSSLLATALLSLCAAGLPASGFAQTPSTSDVLVINIGTEHMIDSKVLGEIRRWSLRLPAAQADDGSVTLIYVLDGEKLFLSTAAQAGFFEKLKISRLGPAAVVGIENGGNRTFDLTPTASAARRDGSIAPEGKPQGGGAGRFLAFLERELMPAAEAALPQGSAVKRRILVGHSFAGLFALNALKTKPELFDDYVALDPSLWWDRSAWAEAFIKDGAASSAASGKRLYVAFAAAKRRANELHMSEAEKFSTEGARRLRAQGVAVYAKTFPEEVHGTIAIPGIFDALKTLYAEMPND